MARNRGDSKLSLLGRMTFAPEARSQDTPRPVIEGRFKYFFGLFKLNNNLLMIANLLFLVFCIPLLVVLILPSLFGGMESVNYLVSGIKVPYFMTEIGFGISSGQALIDGKLGILRVYQYLFLAIACTLPIISFGASGMFNVTMKFVWQDSFFTKKDSYGNNVPRIGVEFFRGVKKYFAPFLVIFTVFALFFAGVSSGIIFFIKSLWLNQAGFWHWLLLIVSCLVGLFGIMVLLFMLPMVPMFDMPILSKLKNSIILILSMFLPAFFMALITILPFILISVLGGFFRVLLIAAVLIFGGSFYSLMWTNFAQYYADKIITPVYEAQKSRQPKKKQKKTQ